VNAPAAQINFDYYEDLTPESLTRILEDLAAGKEVKPGPQIDRQLSAPIGGATTLTDPNLYTRGIAHPKQEPVLSDADAKKPGEPANIREAPMPTPPIGDPSANRQS
jgi:NADH-quinone oxidoreductase subunit E